MDLSTFICRWKSVQTCWKLLLVSCEKYLRALQKVHVKSKLKNILVQKCSRSIQFSKSTFSINLWFFYLICKAEKNSSFIYWFTPQMPAIGGIGQGQSLEQETQSKSPIRVAETQLLEHWWEAQESGARAGVWNGSILTSISPIRLPTPMLEII